MASLPCGSMVSLHDSARCWPIPGAEKGYGTSSPLSPGRNLSVPPLLVLCVPKVQLCPSSCSTEPSGTCGLTAQHTCPCKSTLLCHGTATDSAWSTRSRCPLPPVCRAMQTVVCANNWDLLLVPGAEISQSCALGRWWAQDDRRRPKGGAHTHVGSKAPACKQAFLCMATYLQGPCHCREDRVLSSCWCCSGTVNELLTLRDDVPQALFALLQIQSRFLTGSLREQPHEIVSNAFFHAIFLGQKAALDQAGSQLLLSASRT